MAVVAEERVPVRRDPIPTLPTRLVAWWDGARVWSDYPARRSMRVDIYDREEAARAAALIARAALVAPVVDVTPAFIDTTNHDVYVSYYHRRVREWGRRARLHVITVETWSQYYEYSLWLFIVASHYRDPAIKDVYFAAARTPRGMEQWETIDEGEAVPREHVEAAGVLIAALGGPAALGDYLGVGNTKVCYHGEGEEPACEEMILGGGRWAKHRRRW